MLKQSIGKIQSPTFISKSSACVKVPNVPNVESLFPVILEEISCL